MPMEVKPALALPAGLEVTALEVMENVLTITAVSTQVRPACPFCGMSAVRVPSRYTRQVADLPCGGHQVRLRLQVRKYFCDVLTCARRVFVERLTPFVEPWARVTQRLYQIVQVIGLATGGRLGVRVTDRLGIRTSRHTILRRIMALPTDPVGQVIELGIDDFAFRRGRTYHAPHNLAKTVIEFSVCILRAHLRQRCGVAYKRAALRYDAGRDPSASQEGASPP